MLYLASDVFKLYSFHSQIDSIGVYIGFIFYMIETSYSIVDHDLE